MRNRSYNTKAIVEAGLITSLVVVIMLMNVYIPIFSMLGMLILPIPITVLCIRQNSKVAICSVIASAIIIAMVYNPISALSSSVLFGITGITLGYLIKNDKKVSTIILFLAVAFAISIIIDFGIYVSLVDKRGIVGFINSFVSQLKDSMNISKQMYIKMGISEQQIASMEKLFNIFNADFIMKMIPALIITTSIICSYLNYVITEKILKKLRYDVKPVKPFAEFYVNAKIGSFIGIFLVIGLILKRNNIPVGDSIASSSQVILEIALLLDGFALTTYYLRKKFKMSKTFVVIIIVLTGFSQLSIIYAFAGLWDIFFNFRKLNPYQKEKNK